MQIKWNEYTWYSKLAAAIFFILVMPVWTFYLGMQYEETKYILDHVPEVSEIRMHKVNQTNSEELTGIYTIESVGVTMNEPYTLARAKILKAGFQPYIPESYVSNSGETHSTKPLYPEFPELDSCGTGVDAVCSVTFSDKDGHLLPFYIAPANTRTNPTKDWIVVGNP